MPDDTTDLLLTRLDGFVHANAHRMLTGRDLAVHARLSLRDLHAALRGRTGLSPSSYIRARRLGGVHADLHRSGAGAADLPDLARRWGFTHVGRMCDAYEAQFGCRPDTSLQEHVA